MYNIQLRYGTFNLPSTTSGRTIVGGTAAYLGSVTKGYVPNITGTSDATAAGYNDYLISWLNSTGAFYGVSHTTSHGVGGGGSHGSTMRLGFDASRSSSCYVSGATEVRPHSIAMLYCIKF